MRRRNGNPGSFGFSPGQLIEAQAVSQIDHERFPGAPSHDIESGILTSPVQQPDGVLMPIVPDLLRIPENEGVKLLILHPPVLPYGYTLHHRFQRIWEASEYVRRIYPETKVLDAGLLNKMKGQVLNEFAANYDAVACYAEPQMLPVVTDLLERLRYIAPATRILVYGPATVCFPAAIRRLDVDAYGARGDAEAQLRQFADFVTERSDLTSNLCIRKGNRWSDPEGLPETVPQDQWGFPPLTEMPLDDIRRIYEMKDQPCTIAVTASRGCPYSCTFCATPNFEGRPDRRRSVRSLVQFISDNRHHPHWQFYSPTFTIDRAWCVEFLTSLGDVGAGVTWRCTTRVDRLDHELVELMAATGCCAVGLGVETLGPGAMLLKKHITRDQIASAIKLLTEHGIRAKAYVMLGLPNQSLDDVQETIRFVTDLGGEVRPTMYSPQGEADTLTGAHGAGDLGALDRKSFLAGRDNYGEFLRLAFDRSLGPPSM